MQDTRRQRLTRSQDRMLGGVAGGLADYVNLDPTVVRLLVVLSCLLSLGITLLAYVVLWIVVPDATDTDQPARSGTSAAAQAAGVSERGEGRDHALLFGVLLVGAGALLLLNEFTVLDWVGGGLSRFWWPGVLIAGGGALIAMRRN